MFLSFLPGSPPSGLKALFFLFKDPYTSPGVAIPLSKDLASVMPSLLQRQIFREIAHIFVLCATVLLMLILISRAVQMRELLLGLDMSLLDTARLFAYMTPTFLLLVIPISCMLAAFLTFLRMGTDREMVALRAGGVSIYQMLPAPVLFSVLCVGLTLWVSLHWVSWGMSQFRSTVMDIATTRARIVAQPGVFSSDFPKLVLFARNVDPDKGTLYRVMVNDRSHEGRDITILAPEGEISSDSSRGELVFTLRNGQLYSTTGEQHSVLSFGVYAVRLPLNAIFKDVNLGGVRPRELSWDELRRVRRDYRARMAEFSSGKENEYRDLLNYTLKIDVERQKRWAYPAACLALTLFVLPLATAFQGMRRQMGMVIALVMFFVYYGMMSVGFTLGESGVLPPAIGLWLPNALFLLGGLVGLRFAARERTINTGGIASAVRARLGIFKGKKTSGEAS